MSIRRNFDDMYDLFDQFSGIEGSFEGRGVNVDVADETDAFVVTADVPGFDASDVSVTLRGQTLVIEAQTTAANTDESTSDDVSYIRHERTNRSFSRSIRLPGDVVTDAVSATLVNGVLTVTLPKVSAEERDVSIDVQ